MRVGREVMLRDVRCELVDVWRCGCGDVCRWECGEVWMCVIVNVIVGVWMCVGRLMCGCEGGWGDWRGGGEGGRLDERGGGEAGVWMCCWELG